MDKNTGNTRHRNKYNCLCWLYRKGISCEYLSLVFSLFTVRSASVSALQIVFSNSLYESTAKWEASQIFKEDIVGAHLAGASVTKTATLLGVYRAAVSKVVMMCTNHGRISFKKNSGRKPKLMKGIAIH